MLKEKVWMDKRDAAVIVADFGQAGVEGYAMAFLKLCNNAREYPDTIWHIENNSDNKVTVVCPLKAEDRVKDFLTDIVYRYDVGAEEGKKAIGVGKVVDSWHTKIGVFERSFDSTAKYGTDQYDKDIDEGFEVEFFTVGDAE